MTKNPGNDRRAKMEKWAAIVAITLIVGVIGMMRWFATQPGPPSAVPRGADADDAPAGATALANGSNFGSLSPGDLVDYWTVTVGGLDLIKVAINASYYYNVTVYDSNLAEISPVYTMGENLYSASQIPWEPQQAYYVRVVNNTETTGDYILTFEPLAKTQQINTFIYQFAIIAMICIVLISITTTINRKVVNPLEQAKKRRPLLFVTFAVVSALVAWQYFQMNDLYAQVTRFYADSRAFGETWVYILTLYLIIGEILLASINLGVKKRIPYILARGLAYGELIFVFFEFMMIDQNYLPGGLLPHFREVVVTFPILCGSFLLRKETLALYGQSFGVFSFKKDKKIGRAFKELYEREELVPIAKIMGDFSFESRRVRKAQIQLMKVLHRKAITGEYDEKTKLYFPKERSATQKALQKMAIDQKKRLFGILKTIGRIHLRQDQKYIGLTREDLIEMINELRVKGLVEGEFEGDAFLLKSDVNTFIMSLENSFAEWTGKVDSGEGKKT